MTDTRHIVTVAGGGPHQVDATSASIAFPVASTWDAAGNVYIPIGEEGRFGFGCPIFQGQNRVVRIDTERITVVAGSGPAGYEGDGGPAPAALLMNPGGVAVDAAGNVFVSDKTNHRVRRIDALSGIIQTVAGNGVAGFGGDEGPATEASINGPRGLALDGSGNLFIADKSNCRMRRVDAASGTIHTVAGSGTCGFSGDEGLATQAALSGLEDVAVDSSGNLYIGDTLNFRVRRVDAVTGVISTVAGNGVRGFSGDGGPATSASLKFASGVSLDAAGNLYIADYLNHRVRKVEAGTGIITSVVLVTNLNGVEADGAGNLLITVLTRVLRWSAATGTLSTVAGNPFFGFSGDGWPATGAVLDGPIAVAADGAGNVFVNDAFNNRIRRISAATGIIQTVAGGGTGGDGGLATSARLTYARGIHVDSGGNLFIAQAADCEFPLEGSTIRRVDADTGVIATVAGNGSGGFSGDGGPATSASLNWPRDMTTDAAGNLIIADSSNHRVRRVDAATGVITTIAGNGVFGFGGDGGPATAASLRIPASLALDSAGGLYIADGVDHRVRRVNLATGIITTVAGTGVQGYSGDGGPATSARLNDPSGVEIDGSGKLIIADRGNHRVRSVDPSTGIITTLAGTGVSGFSGDTGPADTARIGRPWGIAVGPFDEILIADKENNRVRSVTTIPPPAGKVPSGPGSGLEVTVTPDGGTLVLSWPASCLFSDGDYEIYEGAMGDYTSHAPRLCTTGGARSVSLSPSPGDTYYLVVPRNLSREGSYGLLGDGSERPPSASACLPQKIADSCP